MSTTTLERPATRGFDLDSQAVRAPSQHFEVRVLDAALGTEIIGIDLGRPLNAADLKRVHQAHLDHHVVVFRDQDITPAQHIAFSRHFGKLMIHVLHQFHLPHHPEI